MSRVIVIPTTPPLRAKLIPNFSRYAITDDGQVFNEHFRRLSTYKNAAGYVFISLKNDQNVRTGQSIHRLVWRAWRGEIDKRLWVNHINGMKDDNRLENLEVGTPSYNHQHAIKVLKRKYAQGEQTGTAKLNEDSIKAIRLLSSLDWSAHRLARAFGVSQPTVTYILNKKTWKHML